MVQAAVRGEEFSLPLFSKEERLSSPERRLPIEARPDERPLALALDTVSSCSSISSASNLSDVSVFAFACTERARNQDWIARRGRRPTASW